MNALASQQDGIFAPETSTQRQPLYVITEQPQFAGELPTPTPHENQVVPTDGAASAKPDRKPRFLYRIHSDHENRVFRLLQLWEGKVTCVDADVFEATLTDRTKADNPEEQVIIDRQELDEGDQALLRPGAILYWSIGYEEEPGRPRRRISQIRLRRLPGWTRQELEEVKSKAAHLADLFA